MDMLTLIVNPAAGNGFARKVTEQLRQELEHAGRAFQFLYTEYPGHATELARHAVQDGECSGVIAVGGDGTAYEVACGLLGTSVPFGIIPSGTGNDFVKTVGIPKKPLEALRFILKSKPRAVDVGSLNDRMFLNVCGTGFDVTVLDYTVAAKKYCRGIAVSHWPGAWYFSLCTGTCALYCGWCDAGTECADLCSCQRSFHWRRYSDLS